MLIKNVTIVTSTEIFDGYVEFDNGVITKVGKGKTESAGIDGKNNYLLPAFWDLHTHGGYGFSFNDIANLNEELAKNYLNQVCREGVSGVLVTAVTDSYEHIGRIIANYKTLKKWDTRNILRGLYFEGPFISKIKKGAHDPNLMFPPTIAGIDHLLAPDVKVIAVTPEEGADETYAAIAYAAKTTRLSIGHSNATAEQFLKAVNSGVTRITHMFNAMTGFDHRGAGVVNGIFACEGLFVEIIPDTVHIEPLVVNETLALLSDKHQFFFVSDSLSLKGMPDGPSMLGSMEIEKRGDFCYLRGSPNLSGSCLRYDQLVKRYLSFGKTDLKKLVEFTALNPAKSLGVKNEGEIAEGNVCSFILLDENNFSLQKVFVRGEKIEI